MQTIIKAFQVVGGAWNISLMAVHDHGCLQSRPMLGQLQTGVTGECPVATTRINSAATALDGPWTHINRAGTALGCI